MSSDSTSILLPRSSPQTDISNLREQATDRFNAIRGGLIAVLVFAACFWAAWPIAEMGFDDDWTYAKSAQVFAQTGHLIYNGWASAMVGWLIPWGALFVRLFGFSFTAVKLSTLPIAMGALFLFHLIQMRFGISARNAVIGTLTLGLSPMFLPLAASYMTDVPGLFVILLCLYCCLRAIGADTNKAAVAWLCIAAASNVAGGTVRQIAWLGSLVMVPATGWLLRKRRGVLPAVSVFWISSVACVLYCMHWFADQPYSISALTFPGPRPEPLALILIVTMEMAGEFLCLLLLVFPVLVAWLPQLRKLKRDGVFLVAIYLLIFAYAQWLLRWKLPWVGNVIDTEFSSSRVADLSQPGGFILGTSACLIFSLLLAAAFVAFIAIVRTKLRDPRGSESTAFLHEVFWLFLPFILSYCVLLLPHASDGMAFDRYMLQLMPFAIICFIALYQDWIAPNLPMSSVLALAIYALLATAGTHDWFASQRARLTAIDEIRATGVSRTNIHGGFEYDSWTQLEAGGHINSPLLKNPPGAFQPGTQHASNGCESDVVLPAVHPKYFVAVDTKPCRGPSKYPPVHFHTWLPPFYGTIEVQEIVAPAR